MSVYSDYKAYKAYEPLYAPWKENRELLNAKRQEYLKQNPHEINQEDIRRGKTFLRAIDIMDENSQKRAENLEVVTEQAVGLGLEAAMYAGGFLGALGGLLKPIQNLVKKFAPKIPENKLKAAAVAASGVAGGVISMSIAAFPLFNWASKKEIAASRKGRFAAMNNELKSPNGFAILTEEQTILAKNMSKNIKIKDKEKKKTWINNSFTTLKDLAGDTTEYKKQRQIYELECQNELLHINDEMTSDEILKSKKDQQILTKLVEKIDIASQDYAENAELVTQNITIGMLAFGALWNMIFTQLLNKLNIKNTKIVAASSILGFALPVTFALLSTKIQKEASRVGRFKVKQELAKHPEQLVYVDDEKVKNTNISNIVPEQKENTMQFLKHIYKDYREYKQYQKTFAKDEERFYQALEQIELSPEQIKEAKRLRKNTFKTFNKVDEKSQKYAENVEALGNSLNVPINNLCTILAFSVGIPFLVKSDKAKSAMKKIEYYGKYMGSVTLGIIPSMLMQVYITKEQKKASRIADMLAIDELKNYREFK